MMAPQQPYGGRDASPRRRITLFRLSQEQHQYQHQHQHQHHQSQQHNLLYSSSVTSPTLKKSMLSFHQEQPIAPELPLSTATMVRNRRLLPSMLHKWKKRNILIFVVLATCLIVTTLNRGVYIGGVIRGLERMEDANFETQRRLWSPDISNSNKEGVFSSDALFYLSFGGPLTYGRGLDESQRNSQAYPYLLTSHDRVHNVAYRSHETTDPIMASLCTQSVVEGMNGVNSSIEYNVITLEYSFAAADTTKEAYLSSMELLVHRLRQRYPQSEIILIKTWTPSDLVRFEKSSNSKVSYDEWKQKQNQQPRNQQLQNKVPVAWSFRELSPIETEVEEQLEATMASVGGLVAKLPLPETLNESLLNHWFLQESYNNDTETNTGSQYLIRYTLSQMGHAILAKSIQSALHNRQTEQLPRPTHPLTQQRLYSWGSGDFCQLWYDTGLLNPSSFSGGMELSEIAPSLHALEVLASKDSKLRVHNPFTTDRIVYLTYLTASEMATSNKVYPKTKVKMTSTRTSATVENKKESSRIMTGVLLDPSHGTGRDHQLHFTRTSAVGILPAGQAGTLEFTTLEKYTIHPFRIVGVSILNENDDNRVPVPFEFSMFAPRKLPMDKGPADEEFDDDAVQEDAFKPQWIARLFYS